MDRGLNPAKQNWGRCDPLVDEPAAWSGGDSRVASTLADTLAVGDPEAFAALYDRLAARLFNTARILTSAGDAEDIVHHLFVELARSRQRLAGVVDLEAYVFTMLRHAISRRRRRFAIDRKALGRIAAERLRAGGSRESPPRLPDDELAAVMHTSLNTAASRYR
jgi:DNA-directed RNA polymerase specialized sigma24 family protein